MDHPEDTRCVALAVGEQHPDYGKAWCGRLVYFYVRTPLAKVLENPARYGNACLDVAYGPPAAVRGVWVQEWSEWCFTSATHALLTRRSGDLLTICRACAAAMRAALDTNEGG